MNYLITHKIKFAKLFVYNSIIVFTIFNDYFIIKISIFSINVRKKDELKKAVDLNTAVARYFDDREFRTLLNNYLSSLRVAKTEKNIIAYIANAINKQYEKYMEGFTRNLYIPRWI